MSRVLWVIGELFAGVMVAGALSGIAVPLAARTGRDVGPEVVWLMLGTGIALCVVAGERLRRARQRDRLP